MAEWLVNRLAAMNASALTLIQITENLGDIATNTFAKPAATVGLTFVFAGFGPHGPLAATVSNLEDGKTSFPAPTREFVCGYLIRNEKRMRKLALVSTGARTQSRRRLAKPFPGLGGDS